MVAAKSSARQIEVSHGKGCRCDVCRMALLPCLVYTSGEPANLSSWPGAVVQVCLLDGNLFDQKCAGEAGSTGRGGPQHTSASFVIRLPRVINLRMRWQNWSTTSGPGHVSQSGTLCMVVG
jgi:hypothetical protein